MGVFSFLIKTENVLLVFAVCCISRGASLGVSFALIQERNVTQR